MLVTAPKLFFVHLMKTGGASFRAHLRTVLDPDRIFPNGADGADDLIMANLDIQRLLGLDQDRRARIDAYTGHFPYVTTRLLGEEVWTATIVREPVGRTVSYLKHCRRYDDRHEGRTLEQIYDDPDTNAMMIRNYQSKLFAMTEEDRLETQLDVIDVDESRIEIAMANLDSVDVVGVHDRYAEFLQAMSARTGWQFGRVGRWRPGEADQASDDLRRRIAEDNAMDTRFYEHACRVVERDDQSHPR